MPAKVAASLRQYSFQALPDFTVRVTGGEQPYIIDPRPRGWSCTCPAFAFAPAGQPSCKHIDMLRTQLAARAREPLAEAIAHELATVLVRVEKKLTRRGPRRAGALAVRQWWRDAGRQASPSIATGRALATWRRELAAGTRTTQTFDSLWRAACDDAAAVERGTRTRPSC